MSSYLYRFIFYLLIWSICMCDTKSDYQTINLHSNGVWIGAGASYGPFRDGQKPGEGFPSIDQLREDLHIISNNWKWIRVYGSRGVTSDIIKIIDNDSLDIKVMLGAWISKEEGIPGAEANNKKEIDHAINLAKKYPDIVNCINVGNETMIYWSDHKVDVDRMLDYINYTKERVSVPVTTADDLGFWNKEESKIIADSCDFIVIHIHPMWGGKQVDEALEWVKGIYFEVQSRYPDKQIVIGETGWATMKHNSGLQHELIKGAAGEEEQLIYYNIFSDWATSNKIPYHFFEIFDEKWKGGEHPNEVEKHWGVYYSNRQPKKVLQ